MTPRPQPSSRPASRPWTIAQRITWLALVPAALVVGTGSAVLRQQMHDALYASMAQTLQDKHQRVAARLRPGTQQRLGEPPTSADEFSTIYSGWYWQAQADVSAAGAAPSEPRAAHRQPAPGASASPSVQAPSSAPSNDADNTASAHEAQVPPPVAGRAVTDVAAPSMPFMPRGVSRSLWDAPSLVAHRAVGPAALGLVQATGPLGEPLIGWQQRVAVSGLDVPVSLTVYGPATALRTSLQRIDHILLTTAIALVALLAVLLAVQLRVGLLPLRRFAQAVAAQRDPAQAAEHAVPHVRVGADLAPLQQELQALLQQNAQVVSRARAHAADLNHALKKPLALLTAAASQQPSVSAAEVLQHSQTLTELIDRYQARTWSDATQARAATGTVNVADSLREVVHAMRRLHAAQELNWHLDLPDSIPWLWRGDATDLAEVLGNLLDNAGKWAASTVAVQASAEGDSLWLHIEDDGPGMSAEQLQRAGQRGLRFDESVSGHGLGLAIARQVAHAYGGELVLAKSARLKGLRASLRLTPCRMASAAPASQGRTGAA